MVSHLFFYQLVLIALVWLCVMLHWVWPSDPAPVCRRHRSPHPHGPSASREPTPFAGLTTKPLCDACAHATAPHPQAPSAPPPAPRAHAGAPPPGRHLDAISARTRTVPIGAGSGWGNLRANGHPNGGPWWQLLCVVCRRYFLETLGTIFHGKRASVELIVRVIACLAEGLGIRGTARVFEVDPNTVLQWLVEAAEQLRAFSQHFLHDMRVRQVQLDELFALLSAVKDGEVSEAEAIERLERSPQWVWVAMDPESKLLLAIDVGNRTLAMAQRCGPPRGAGVGPGLRPAVSHRWLSRVSDGLADALWALGAAATPPGHKAPCPSRAGCRCPQLLYAQVIKTVRRRRLVGVSTAWCSARWRLSSRCWRPAGWQINTAFVERLNLTIRQHVAAVGRRVSTLCKGEDGLRQQLPCTTCTIISACRMPACASLCRSLCPPRAWARLRCGGPVRQRWPLGLTDQVWTLREVLLFRVPPWPQPAEV